MEFRILGPLEVVEDGRPLPLERRRMRALLAFLLLHANELVSADRLIDEVWGPEPPKTAGASLQNYVSRLRKAIGAETVVSQPPGYVLRIDPEQFDLTRFERLTAEARGAESRERAEKLRAALALWRGPALDDLAFEPFARDEVGRLEEARLAALEECIDAQLELGRDGDLLAELEELVEQHPLRERFRAQLMRALYRAGRQADALAAFQSARDVLIEELGLEPGEELRGLQQAILRQDPSLGPAAAAVQDSVADRRTVTVLFCDLVGSTGFATELDPEAYRALLSRYFELVREPVERHGGTLEKFIGDAVLAVFGVPALHEDDALRAVRAAVEAQHALREADIAARIGIASGEVHVLSAADEPLHVSGPPASVASHLEARAGAGEVLLSDATYALVRDALRAEKVEGASAWVVHEVVAGAPAFARRLDATLVGRTEELARLRAASADVLEGHCRVVTVVGEAGIGKTRLLRELLLPLRQEARILVGRCASYAEGATYLPIAEAVRQVAPSADAVATLLEHEPDGEQVGRRVAELVGLAHGPGAPGEAFWAVRRFMETLARERPVVLVLDDIHWAEPTLLDLVEYLGKWAAARVLVLCAARRELLEARPAWGGPTSTGFIVELGPLDTSEVAELLARLSADPNVADRIVEQAGGNPLFAEQLLALATEAPELEEIPRTIEALLASRLDRLDSRELAVLRCASVIGRRFTRTELGDLTEPGNAERTEHHLARLAERALIEPREHLFAFRHVLVRDVAYHGIPKRERADLHERAAFGVERRDGPDEIVGYHFEQAHLALAEIGQKDERAGQLAHAGSEHLGRAGIRAWQRADAHAARNLLSRSVALSPGPTDIACELGLVFYVNGELDRAKELLIGIAGADDSRLAARARVELAHVRSVSEPDRAHELADVAATSIPVLEVADDNRALGRAWLSIAHARGDFFCEYAVMEEASMRAVEHYHRAGWSPSTPLGSLGVALYFGPKPVEHGIAALETVLDRFDDDRASEANVQTWLGGLEAMSGAIAQGRAHVLAGQDSYLELGLAIAAADSSERMLGLVEALSANFEAAASHLRKSCAALEQTRQSQVLATRAGELARILYLSAEYDDAETWTRKAQTASGADDLDAALAWKPVDAMLLARRGRAADAERRIDELVQQIPADAVLAKADAFLALAEVLRLAGRDEDAAEAQASALSLYEQKGNLAAASVLQRSEEPRRGSSLMR